MVITKCVLSKGEKSIKLSMERRVNCYVYVMDNGEVTCQSNTAKGASLSLKHYKEYGWLIKVTKHRIIDPRIDRAAYLFLSNRGLHEKIKLVSNGDNTLTAIQADIDRTEIVGNRIINYIADKFRTKMKTSDFWSIVEHIKENAFLLEGV